jgi:AcrR family transcriptional regulator
MARRLDRRVQRTRKLLREALMALILEEGYEEISIQDITEKANLGRATFYLHFKDKDELLLAVMNQLIEDFLEQVPQITEAQWHVADIKALVKLFEFAAEHYDLYRILTIGSGGITAARELQTRIADNIETYIQAELAAKNAQPAVPTDFIANHFAGALLATIYWWLDHDLPYTAEEMATLFQKINQLDRENLLGFDEPSPTSETEEEHNKKKKRGKDKEEHQQAKNDPETIPVEDVDETINTVEQDKA